MRGDIFSLFFQLFQFDQITVETLYNGHLRDIEESGHSREVERRVNVCHVWTVGQKKTKNKSKAPRSELMDELNFCRKDSLIAKEKHINLFERFIVYGLAKIQRDLKYPIACAPEYSRNLLSAQLFYLGTDHKKRYGGGEGNFRAAGIFFRYQIPCMNFF